MLIRQQRLKTRVKKQPNKSKRHQIQRLYSVSFQKAEAESQGEGTLRDKQWNTPGYMHKEERSTGETNEGRNLNHSGGEKDRK